MKYFSILAIIYLLCKCNNEKSKKYAFSLLNNHSKKQWNRIGINGSIYENSRTSDCIVFRDNNKFDHYSFYKNGSGEPLVMTWFN